MKKSCAVVECNGTTPFREIWRRMGGGTLRAQEAERGTKHTLLHQQSEDKTDLNQIGWTCQSAFKRTERDGRQAREIYKLKARVRQVQSTRTESLLSMLGFEPGTYGLFSCHSSN